nr:hypothetical protein Iba_chr10bCG12940 [Ipomoea batatas]
MSCGGSEPLRCQYAAPFPCAVASFLIIIVFAAIIGELQTLTALPKFTTFSRRSGENLPVNPNRIPRKLCEKILQQRSSFSV